MEDNSPQLLAAIEPRSSPEYLSASSQRETHDRGSPLRPRGFIKPLLVWLISLLMLSPTDLGEFGFDSAAFSYVAQVLQSGGNLYRDVWDNKQPGIFWFYQVIGQLLGNDWHSLFVGASIWTATTALLASYVILYALPKERWAPFSPLLVVAILATRAETEHIGQIESLVALPLMGIGLCALRLQTQAAKPSDGPQAPWRQYFVPGLVAGALTSMVMSFKLVLAPLAALLFFVTIAPSVAKRHWRSRQLLASVAGFALGIFAVDAAVVGYFIQHESLGEFWWTTFRYPLAALRQAPLAPPERLLGGLRWFAIAASPLLPLALVAVLQGRRLFSGLTGAAALFALTWLGAGFALILAQKFSWWTYHFEMLLWPLGLLAAAGIARIGELLRSAGRLRIALFLPRLIVASVAIFLTIQSVHAVRKRSLPEWPISSDLRSAIAGASDLVRLFGWDSVATACGTGYVIGDPRLLLASGLKQAIPTPGMSWWGAFLPAQLRQLPAQLARAMPDYVYISAEFQAQFARDLPELGQWLDDAYRQLRSDATGGIWWQRHTRDSATSCPRRQVFTVP